eukprot:m.26430 g.26430  ORF g.26430 m.26430 type:complete len:70 (+) comp4286_c0_seq1:913-1122(+)
MYDARRFSLTSFDLAIFPVKIVETITAVVACACVCHSFTEDHFQPSVLGDSRAQLDSSLFDASNWEPET